MACDSLRVQVWVRDLASPDIRTREVATAGFKLALERDMDEESTPLSNALSPVMSRLLLELLPMESPLVALVVSHAARDVVGIVALSLRRLLGEADSLLTSFNVQSHLELAISVNAAIHCHTLRLAQVATLEQDTGLVPLLAQAYSVMHVLSSRLARSADFQGAKRRRLDTTLFRSSPETEKRRRNNSLSCSS